MDRGAVSLSWPSSALEGICREKNLFLFGEWAKTNSKSKYPLPPAALSIASENLRGQVIPQRGILKGESCWSQKEIVMDTKKRRLNIKNKQILPHLGWLGFLAGFCLVYVGWFGWLVLGFVFVVGFVVLVWFFFWFYLVGWVFGACFGFFWYLFVLLMKVFRWMGLLWERPCRFKELPVSWRPYFWGKLLKYFRN